MREFIESIIPLAAIVLSSSIVVCSVAPSAAESIVETDSFQVLNPEESSADAESPDSQVYDIAPEQPDFLDDTVVSNLSVPFSDASNPDSLNLSNDNIDSDLSIFDNQDADPLASQSDQVVRDTLDEMYSIDSRGSDQIDAYIATLAPDQKEIAERYAQAAIERGLPPEELTYIPGEVLIVYKDNEYHQVYESVSESNAYIRNDTTLDLFGEFSSSIANISLEDTVGRAIDNLSEQEGILYVQPNYVYSADSILATNDSPTDADETIQYYLEQVHAQDAWQYLSQIDRSRIRVAVVDSGLDLQHPDLSNIINHDLSVKINPDGQYEPLSGDSTGHGTSVAGILAAETVNQIGIEGVASGTSDEIIDLVAIDASTAPNQYTTSSIIQAMNYCLNHHVRVINLSLGGQLANGQDQLLSDMISEAANYGALVICAAGNAGTSQTFFPAGAADAVGVIALNSDGQTRAEFSNYGDTANKICAPGVDMRTTMDGGDWHSVYGTSFAAPVVSGVAAMILSANPDLSAAQVKNILFSTSIDLCQSGYDEQSGFGIVNASEAVSAAIDTAGAGLQLRDPDPNVGGSTVIGDPIEDDSLEAYTTLPTCRGLVLTGPGTDAANQQSYINNGLGFSRVFWIGKVNDPIIPNNPGVLSTKNQIKQAITDSFSGYPASTSVYLFISCHGGFYTNGEMFLQLGTNARVTASELKTWIRSATAAKVKMFVNACYSGSLIGQEYSDVDLETSLQGFANSFSEMTSQNGELAAGGFYVLCSCASNEESTTPSNWYSNAVRLWLMGIGWTPGEYIGDASGYCALRADTDGNGTVTFEELHSYTNLLIYLNNLNPSKGSFNFYTVKYTSSANMSAASRAGITVTLDIPY